MARINSAVKFKPGDVIPDLKIPNQTNHMVPISGVTGQLSAIVFWVVLVSSLHVRELPKLKALYDNMQGKLGVYAVSRYK